MGQKGFEGAKGMKGLKGFKGEKGEKGTEGDKGTKGIKAVEGTAGENGVQGEKGLKGHPGFPLSAAMLKQQTNRVDAPMQAFQKLVRMYTGGLTLACMLILALIIIMATLYIRERRRYKQ